MEVKKLNQYTVGVPWSPEEDIKLREMWPAYSSYQLATVFGRSRMAIIGRASRLGMKKGTFKRDRSNGRKTGGSTLINLKTLFVKDTTYNVSRVKLPPTKPNQEIMAEPFLGVHIADIKNNQCRYMHESSTLTFCGHEVQEHSSYCPNHHKHMFTGEKALNKKHHRYFAR
jgi:hypothetical protein